MRRLMLLLTLAACGDNTRPAIPEDAGRDAATVVDAAIDAAAVDAAPGRLTGCLDRPGLLSSSPAGQLPCDLVPPGLTL